MSAMLAAAALLQQLQHAAEKCKVCDQGIYSLYKLDQQLLLPAPSMVQMVLLLCNCSPAVT